MTLTELGYWSKSGIGRAHACASVAELCEHGENIQEMPTHTHTHACEWMVTFNAVEKFQGKKHMVEALTHVHACVATMPPSLFSPSV